MPSRIATWFMLILVSVFSGPAAWAGPPEVGEMFPLIFLPTPESGEHRDYLGVDPDKDSFCISCIKGELLIVEMFSMYCPHCQREAPAVNELYNEISRRGLEKQILLIGLGAGNSEYEVDFFRKKYEIEFPLFADPDFEILEALDTTSTPYFWVIDIRGVTAGRTMLANMGPFEPPESFLNRVVEILKGEKEESE